MNKVTHCVCCKKELVVGDRYEISPDGGCNCTTRAWCNDCWERLHREAAKNIASKWNSYHEDRSLYDLSTEEEE